MIRQTYYNLSPDTESNLKIDSVPLAVNCTGIEFIDANYMVSKIRHDYYLIVPIDGSMPVNVNNTVQVLNPNTFMIIEPETPYSHKLDSGAISYYWIHFSGNNIKEMLKQQNITTNIVHKTNFSDEVKNCFSCLFKEFLIKDEKFDFMTNAIFIQILSYLSRNSNTTSKYKYLVNSINYIYNNYNKQIDVKKLADMEHLSISRYRSIFKKQVGVPLLDFIIMLRIDTACFYLNQTSMSISEISSAVGYTNPFYFSRIFKQKTGKSPKQYRSR